MAIEMFIRIDGIDGESRDRAHKNEIDVLAWSWGASQSGTTHAGQGGGAGKANIEDLSFTKYVDTASTELLQRVFDGKHIDEATLFVLRGGDVRGPKGERPDYVEIELEDIIVTSVSAGGTGGEDRLTETVTLNFSKVRQRYTPVKDDGSKGKQKKAGWDIAANKKLA